MHTVDDAHDTPLRTILVPAAGFGVAWIVQMLPLQRSANVTSLPLLLVKDPTATQVGRATHETPLSALLVAPLGSGVAWTFHVEPFQRSANDAPMPEMSVEDPTATQAALDTHDTDESCPAGSVGGGTA